MTELLIYRQYVSLDAFHMYTHFEMYCFFVYGEIRYKKMFSGKNRFSLKSVTWKLEIVGAGENKTCDNYVSCVLSHHAGILARHAVFSCVLYSSVSCVRIIGAVPQEYSRRTFPERAESGERSDGNGGLQEPPRKTPCINVRHEY